MDDLPELGFYGLAGHSATPRDLLAEVAEGERLGLGSVFLSERFATKEAATLSGAAAATTVDWQTLTVGLPARDLSYFLATSLTTEDRRTHEF